jgi:hypothetical protein
MTAAKDAQRVLPRINTGMMISDGLWERVPPSTIQSYIDTIQPTTYLVLHLNRFLRDSDTGVLTYGTQEIYDRQAYKFVCSVSRRVLGSSAYRNRPPCRKRLANIATLEAADECPHVNIAIRKPEHWLDEEFREVCWAVWDKMKWFSHTPRAFFCEPRTGNPIKYSVKEGEFSLLPRSLSFEPKPDDLTAIS